MAGSDVKQLLGALLSTDNDIRTKAEVRSDHPSPPQNFSLTDIFQESYEGLPIEQKVNILLGAISNAAEIPEEGRQLSAVMLRRLFSSEFDEFFGKVSTLTVHWGGWWPG